MFHERGAHLIVQQLTVVAHHLNAVEVRAGAVAALAQLIAHAEFLDIVLTQLATYPDGPAVHLYERLVIAVALHDIHIVVVEPRQ